MDIMWTLGSVEGGERSSMFLVAFKFIILFTCVHSNASTTKHVLVFTCIHSNASITRHMLIF